MAAMLMKVSCAVVLLVVYMGLLTPEVEALSYTTVVASVSPCLAYLAIGGTPLLQCCNGVRGLRDIAKTTDDLMTICECLKDGYSLYPTINGKYIADLPGKCGVNLPYKISPSINCNRIQSSEGELMEKPKFGIEKAVMGIVSFGLILIYKIVQSISLAEREVTERVQDLKLKRQIKSVGKTRRRLTFEGSYPFF